MSTDNKETGDEEEIAVPPASRVDSVLPMPVSGPQLESFHDHFTLHTRSTIVRFRSKTNSARVIETPFSQIVLEEEVSEESRKSEITIKYMRDGTPGLQLLRASYTVIAALFTGFLAVFSLNVLLFLVLDAAIVSGAATATVDQEVHIGQAIGVILALIVFIHGLSSGLVVAGHFVSDIYNGHILIKRFMLNKYSDVIVDWAFFFFFILVPALTASFGLLAKSDVWWSNTAIVWFCCVIIFFTIFVVNIVYVEVSSAYAFMKNRDDTDRDDFLDVVKRAVLLTQIQTYSGKRKATYIARSTFRTTEDTETTDKSKIYEETRKETIDPWSAFTRLDFVSSLFIAKDPPVRLYTIDDVGDRRPWLTKHSWSLEKVFCRPADSRFIAVVKGPGALRKGQITSSAACSFIGTALILLAFVSLLVWLGLPGAFVAFAFAVGLIVAYRSLDNTRRLVSVSKDLIKLQSIGLGGDSMKDDEAGKTEEEVARDTTSSNPNISEGVYLVTQLERVTEATELVCWIMLGVEIVVFFLYPLITLYTLGNSMVGSLFLVVAVVSGIRRYLNAAIVIEETGNMELVDGTDETERWTNKSRFNEVVEAITVGRSRRVWSNLLGVAGFAFMAIFLSAVGSSTVGSFTEEFTYLPDFIYPELENDMRYQTCRLGGLNMGFKENSSLADYTFLSYLAYRPENLTQDELDIWFSDTSAIDDQATVKEFRDRVDSKSAVHFKLVVFEEQDLGVIVIRGTQTNWDMLADSQLWSAAALMQGLRALLPFGELWTPIFDSLVLLINGLQSESVERVSFYKLTTKFAKEMINTRSESFQVTGHSLGGGLSIITGSQAKLPAIALSGPNALISGRSFDPPVTPEQLNKYTFNIIPNRDVVPMLDDHADQIQTIRCSADLNDFVGCHDPVRATCELLYTCGSGNRPPLCICHTRYNFPRPMPTGERTFEEACAAELAE